MSSDLLNPAVVITEELEELEAVPLDTALSRIRVSKESSGMWKIQDFSSSTRSVSHHETLPEDFKSKVSMLMVLDNDEELEGVGFKYNEKIFYVDR